MLKQWWQWLTQKVRSVFAGNSTSEANRWKQPSFTNFEMTIDLTREPIPNLGLPPNAIPGLSTIKALVRGLRYRTIDHLVGQSVVLTSIEKAPAEICSLVRPYDIDISGDIDNLSVGAFLKYGLLDYDFPVVNTELEVERKPVRFLKELGLLLDKEQVDDGVFPDAGLGFLEEMLDEVEVNKLLFKVILESRGKYRGGRGMPNDKWKNADPDKYFPCEFVIRDACLTNCKSIWLQKHFYL